MPNLLLLTLFSISWIANAQNMFLSIQHSTKPMIITDGVDEQSSFQEAYNLKTKVEASVSDLDCISCIANSYLWVQNTPTTGTCTDSISQSQSFKICTPPVPVQKDPVTSLSNFVNGNYTSSGIIVTENPNPPNPPNSPRIQAQVVYFSNQLKDKLNVVIYCNPTVICYYETQPDKSAIDTPTKITQVTQELPPEWYGVFIFIPDLKSGNFQPILQQWSFTVVPLPQAKDCISCMLLNSTFWWSSIGCTSQNIANSFQYVTNCIKNGFLPALQNSLDLSANLSFSNGALQSQAYSFTSPQNPDMMLNLTNLFDKNLNISLIFNSNVDACYVTGQLSDPQLFGFRSGTTLSLNQNSIGYLIFYAPSGFQEITLNANVSSIAQDCITCVVQKQFWNQATQCSPSNYVPSSSQSSIGDCLSANLYSNQSSQSYLISSDHADFQNGQATINLIPLTPDMYDYVLVILNGFNKPVSFTLTFNEQALNSWGANINLKTSESDYFSNLTFQPYAGKSVQTLSEKGSAFVIVLNATNPATYNVTINVTLSTIANDCITCVLNQRMWSQQTLCSPAEQSPGNNYKINDCLQNLLVPIAQETFEISQYLSFVSGTFSKQQYTLPGGKNQDMLVIVDNRFAEKVTLSLSFGTELTTWYGVGTVGSVIADAQTPSSSFNQILSPYEQGVLVLYSNSSTQQLIDIVVTLSSTAIDCISCVAISNVWNPNTLCTTVLNETTVNVYKIDGCLSNNQLPPDPYQIKSVVDETLTFNAGVSVPRSLPFNSQARTDMILFLKNGFEKQIYINLTFPDGVQVWNGTTGLPPNIFNGIQTSAFSSGSSVSLQNKGDQAVFVFYAASSQQYSYDLSYTAQLSRGIYDCIICVANNMVWNQNLFCSTQKIQDPSEQTIGQCVSTNQLPDQQFQKTFVVNGSLPFVKGSVIVDDQQFTLKASESQDMVIFVKNDMGKPATIWMTSFSDALQVYYIDPVTQNASKYLENTGISIKANVQVTFVLYAAAGSTFRPKFKVKLAQGAADCVSCVAINTVTPNTQFWSADTFCSTIPSSLNTILSCLDANLIPEQYKIITVGQSLTFNKGVYQSSYDLVPGSSTDMFIKLINAFQKPFNFTISPCPQAGLILQSAIEDNHDLAQPLLKQMNCGENQTVPSGYIALIVAVATQGISEINLDVRLSTLAPDCISCTQKYLWNPNTFCSEYVGNITTPQQCIQDRQFRYKQGSIGSQDSLTLSPSLGFVAGFTSYNYNVVQGYGNVLTLTNEFEQQVDISLGCDSPGIQIWYSNYSDPNAQQTPEVAKCNVGSMKLWPKQQAIIVFLAQQTTNVNISLTLSSKFSNCVSCVSMGLYWSNSTLCSSSKQSESYTTVQQCVSGGNQPQNQQQIPLDYGVNFVNALFKQELALATSNDPQDLMIIVTNSLQKSVNMTLVCNSQFQTWLGVGFGQVNAQAVLNTFGCNQVVTLGNQQTLVFIAYATLSTTFNLNFKISSLVNGCIYCISQNYYWSQNFLCSQPNGVISNQNLEAMGFQNNIQYCISNNLLPQYQSLIEINQRTALVNGQFSQQYQLNSQKPELMIKLFNSALENFKVLLNCNQGPLSAWFGSSPNINSLILNATQCGQFFTLTTNQTWYLIVSGQQSSFTLNLTVVNPVDCTTCVFQNKYWQSNSLCSHSLYAGSVRNVYGCIIGNQMSQPKTIALPSNISNPLTYSYTIDRINDDFYLEIPNNSSTTIEMNLACSAINYIQLYALQGTGTNVSSYNELILVCNSKIQAVVGKQTNIVVYGSTSSSVNLTITAVIASQSLKLCLAAFGVILSFVIFIF